MDDRPRKEGSHRAAQEPLLREPPHLEVGGKRERQLRHRLVAKWDPGLQRVRHAGAIGLDQEVVDQVDPDIQVLESRQRLGPLRLRIASSVQVERIGAVAAALEELRAQVRREDLLPGVVALDGRQVRPAHEPLCLVVEAHLPRGARQPLDEGSERPDCRAESRCELVRDVGVVAAEQLVSPLSRQSDLDGAGGKLGDEVRWQGRGVGEWLVEHLHQPRQKLRRVGTHDELVVIRPVPLRHDPGGLELVERLLLEPDRERPDGLGALTRRERGQRGRVDPARQQHADGDVRDQVSAHRVAQPLTQLPGQLVRRLRAQLGGGGWTRPRIGNHR